MTINKEAEKLNHTDIKEVIEELAMITQDNLMKESQKEPKK